MNTPCLRGPTMIKDRRTEVRRLMDIHALFVWKRLRKRYLY
jgi:hypothetical protein